MQNNNNIKDNVIGLTSKNNPHHVLNKKYITNNKLKKVICILSNIKRIFKTLLNIFVIIVKDFFF